MQEEHFKNVLLAAELKSEHPLAGAIVSSLQEVEKIVPAQLDSFESITEKESRWFIKGDLLGGQPQVTERFQRFAL